MKREKRKLFERALHFMRRWTGQGERGLDLGGLVVKSVRHEPVVSEPVSLADRVLVGQAELVLKLMFEPNLTFEPFLVKQELLGHAE